MIDLPDFDKAYEYENAFYLTCSPGRVGKLLAHYELFRRAMAVPGVIVECGIFKGPSFCRFAMFRHMFASAAERPMIGFDIFGKFPATAFEADQEKLRAFLAEAGDESISEEQLRDILERKACGEHVEMVKGDILETVPTYASAHPDQHIALLHLDVDIYEPSRCVIEHLYPQLAPGGVLVLDDYAIFPGATKAVDDYFADRPECVASFPYARAPHYIIKPA